jgi:hypothetical protein
VLRSLYRSGIDDDDPRTAAMAGGTDGATPGADGIRLYGGVTLTRAIEYHGMAIPAGTSGGVVHDHGNGGFEVEIEQPDFAVISLMAADLEPR